jgi:hypothetical protein
LEFTVDHVLQKAYGLYEQGSGILVLICCVPYIESKIAEGEHQRQDFKYAVNDAAKIAITLSAFANTDGGTLLIGVRDNGSVAGVKPEEEIHMVAHAAERFCVPPVKFTPQVWKSDNRYVLEVQVPASNARPHFARMKEGDQRAYLRVGDQNLPAPGVLLEVWRGEISERPQKYFHTEKEKKIFDVLEHETNGLSMSQLCRLTGLPRKVMLPLMARLMRWELVEMHFKQDLALFKLIK